MCSRLQAWILPGCSLLPPLLLSLVLILVSRSSYLLFHAFIEFFTIGMAWILLAVLWSGAGYVRHPLPMVVAIGYFWVAAIDLVHVLAYKGMGVFPQATHDANFATQLWIIARLFEALVFLAAPLALRHPVAKRPLFWGLGAVTLLLFGLAIHGGFPDGYREGQGLTGFKIAAELVILALLGLAWGHFYAHRKDLEAGMFRTFSLALGLTALSELSFLFYVRVDDLSNLVGHLFKLFSFWVVYLYFFRYPLNQIRQLLQQTASQAETAQRLADRLRAIVASTASLELWITPDGRLEWANPAVERLLGQTFAEGMDMEAVFAGLADAEDRARLTAWHRQALRDRTSASARSFRLRGQAGLPRWATVSLLPIYDEHQQYLGLRSSIWDIHERVEAERRFDTLLSNISGVNYRRACDPSWTMEFVSEGILELTGYPAEEFIANRVRSYASLLHPEDSASVEAGVRQGVEARQPFTLEYRIVRKDGELRWVHEKGLGVFDLQGRLRYLDGIIDDITERKRREEQLRFQAQLLDNLREAMVAIDLEGRIGYWGKGAERLYGYPAATAMGQELAALVEGEDEPALTTGICQTLEQGRWQGKARQQRQDGSRFWAETFLSRVRDSQDQVRGLIGIVHDISAQHRTEQELRASESLLRQIAAHYPHAYISIIEQDFRIGFTEGQEFKKRQIHPADFVGRSLSEVFGSLSPVVEAHYRKAFAGESTCFELCIDQEFQLYHAIPLDAEGGEIRRILVVVENITERRWREMEQAASADIYQAFLSVSSLPALYQRVTEILHDRLGYPISALELYDPASGTMELVAVQGLPPEKLPLPLRIPVSESLSGRVAESGEAIQEDHAGEHPESRFPLLRTQHVETFVCVPLWSGDRVFGTLTLADPHSRQDSGLLRQRLQNLANQLAQQIARHQAEKALAHRERDFRRLFETIPQGVIYQDIHGAILIANPAAERILGLSLEQMRQHQVLGDLNDLGTSLREDGTPLPRAEYPSRMALHTGREVHNVVMGVFNPQLASRVWIAVDAVPLFDNQGKLWQVYSIFQDITQRRQAKQALLESELRLRQAKARQRLILDTLGEGVYEVDQHGCCTFINQAALTMLGYRHPEDLLGSHMHDRIHHTDARGEPLPRDRCIVHQVFHQEPTKWEDQVFTRADGRRFPVWLHARQMRYQGEVIGVVVSFSDISERKQMEASLYAAKERAQHYLDVAGVLLLVVDADGRVSLINRKGSELIGAPEGDILGRDWFADFVPPHNQAAVRDRFAAMLESCPWEQDEYPILTRGGEERLISWHHAALHEDGSQVTGMLSSGEDITERRAAEQALCQSERRFRELVEGMSDLVYQFSSVRGALYWSPRVEEVLGYSSALLAANPWLWHDFIHPDDLPVVDAAIDSFVSGQAFVIRYRIIDCQQRWHWLEDRSIGREHSADECLIVGIARDITEQVEAEQALHQAKNELEIRVAERTEELENANSALAQAKEAAEAASRAKSLFLANMSHELRTPLNAILGFSQLMVEAPNTSPEQCANLNIINHAGEHLLAMINDVLDLSKIEAGRVELHRESFDGIRLLQDITELFRVRAQAKHLSFQLVLDEAMNPRMTTDPGKLRQILSNLLSNAIKFTEHGEVRLCARTLPPVGAAGSWRLAIEVQDTGRGIAQEHLQDIFQPFVQVVPDSPGQKGTGLGLAICRNFVALLDGTLEARSQAGKGSCFHLEIPIEVAASLSEETSETPDYRRVRGLCEGQEDWRILVIDDDPDSRLLIEKMLSNIGLVVRAGTDGEEAVALFQTWQPHFIWMDIQMPRIGGDGAVTRIRALPGGTAVKIVALTANVLSQERERLLAAGCDDVLAKPFLIAQIFEHMARHLGVRYLYADSSSAVQAQASEPLSPLGVEDLRTLPSEWLNALQAASSRLDVEGTEEILIRLRATHPEIARRIVVLAEKFDYGRLCDLCEMALDRGMPE